MFLPNGKLPQLGKLAPKHDPRTLKLSHYLGTLPPIPTTGGWNSKSIKWPMYQNDKLGDCVVAGAAHAEGQWTYYGQNKEVVFPDSTIVSAYSAVGGYVPGRPDTDQGLNMLDFLKYWKSTGLGGHKIDGFVSINPQDLNQVKAAILLFGNVYLGANLPSSIQGLNRWDVPAGGPVGNGEPGSWGGHCFISTYFNTTVFPCVTWGMEINATPAFMTTYVEEGYAIINLEWLNGNGMSPGHFNLAQLRSDLALL